ncbi:MAG: DUF72 domain-containing protein [Treponema sp.]|nr:MAG: DUF72 domain-containing protein [Treponema sp.]
MENDTNANIEFGTCSWNYDSWIGLVYTKKAAYSAAYLSEYSAHYRTVEVDSWFYKLPEADDVAEYRARTDDGFSFSCKLGESISLTHERSRDKTAPLTPNPDFLSVDVYRRYIDALAPIRDRIFLAELEFEYLNKQKMESLSAFMKALESFVRALETAGIRSTVPLGIECRNSNYLKREYFQFLKDHGIAHVFSEKLYLPHIYELYSQHGDLIGDRAAVRLLGGDRKEIEAKTKNVWNNIVDPKPDLIEIALMLRDLAQGSRLVKVYLNNHYEGSAPKSIERLRALL